MKKTEVNICDNCRRVIAKKKCEICDGDICEDCEDDMAIGLANGGILFYIISCKVCSKKLEKAKLKQYFEEEPHRKLRKDIINIFRNAIIVENLQDNEEQEADRSWMINKLKKRGKFIKRSKSNPFASLLKGGVNKASVSKGMFLK